jgi:hypothetical protein
MKGIVDFELASLTLVKSKTFVMTARLSIKYRSWLDVYVQR